MPNAKTEENSDTTTTGLFAPKRTGCSMNLYVRYASKKHIAINKIFKPVVGSDANSILDDEYTGQCHRYSG